MTILLVKLVSFLLVVLNGIDAACQHPPLAANYTNAKYSGLWYEIGKIQTRFGAAFQKNCVCDVSTISSEFPDYGDALVSYDCRNLTVDGTIDTISGTLTATGRPGNFLQSLTINPNDADYNVIWLDDDTAMEYDCLKNVISEEYCVHFMSRTPSIDPEKLQLMIRYANETLGLNPQVLPYEEILQEGCWTS